MAHKNYVSLITLPNTFKVYVEAVQQVIDMFDKPVNAMVVNGKVYTLLAAYLNAYFEVDVVESVTWSKEHEITIAITETKVSSEWLRKIEHLLDAEVTEIHCTHLYSEERGGWDAIGIKLTLHGWER